MWNATWLVQYYFIKDSIIFFLKLGKYVEPVRDTEIVLRDFKKRSVEKGKENYYP